MKGLEAALAEAIGERHVLADPADLDRYELDGRQKAGRARAVVRPATAAEVSAVVRIAAAHRVAIVPQGARTGLVGAGTVDDRGEMLILSLERLARAPENTAASPAPYFPPASRSRTASPSSVGSQTSYSSPLSLSQISPQVKRSPGIALASSKLVGPHATMSRCLSVSASTMACGVGSGAVSIMPRA